MRTLNPKLWILTLAISAPAYAAKGGSSDGGGNAVCNSVTNVCKMVEQYQVENIAEVKGYSLFKEKLEMVRKDLPELAARIEKAAQSKAWYVIPSDFDLLSLEQTKLQFTTNQAAYQNEKEIFVSQNSLDKMDEEAAAFKLMHESVMAMQKPPFKVSEVRLLTGKIFARGASAKSIQEAAAVNGFGVYFTKTQLQQQRGYLRLSYLEALDGYLKSNERLCDFSAHEVGHAKHRLPNVIETLNSYDDELPQSPFSSPFSASPSYLGGGMMHGVRKANYVQAAKWAPLASAEGNPADSTEKFRARLGDLWASYQGKGVNALEGETMRDALKRLAQPLEEDSFRIRQRLAENPAFLDLLAMQVKMGGNEDQLKQSFSSDPKHQRLLPIYDRVRARLNSVPNNAKANPQKTLSRLCANIESVKADVRRMQDAIKKKSGPRPEVADESLEPVRDLFGLPAN